MNTSNKKNNLLKQNLKNNHAQKRIDSSAIINLFISSESIYQLSYPHPPKDIDVADIRKVILEKAYGKNYTDRINYIPHIPNYSYKYLLC